MIRCPEQFSEALACGAIPRRVGDHTDAPSAIVAAAGASRRPGELVTPAGFLVHLPNRAPARARGLEPLPLERPRSLT